MSSRAGSPSAFSPISCTLIQGESEAVLVDTPISVSQTESLVSWIKETAVGKELKYIYITHGHGDHWFGISVLQKHWPNLRAIATPATVASMKEQLSREKFEGIWLKLFPGDQIPQPLVLATAMDSDTFNIEGHTFRAIEVGHSDTHDTTILHVLSIDLVVAGDVVYGDVHQYFGEANTTEKRNEWLRAIDLIESLKPQTVIAGHKRAGTVDGVFNLRATRQYIVDFENAVKSTSNWQDLWERMKELYPGRINPHAILAGAVAAFPNEGKQ
ncbi:beta-lactamase-like protein [Penicillium samsonianum]|uniref:beta-lactamase-like protein n=1 Tax=Penicillium samsonianum TaxID=1882272 RepID=UPI0025490E5D|nr:beta-lactamase-like protein [Penicillium samsonianum]KAJ6150425.1 beta-lactamase-like protein [Penicillium samsonianum]